MEPYICTYSGKKFEYLNPKPKMIDLGDIAHSLSQICRFTGHTSKFWSVAQHSLLVYDLAPKEYAIHALLHDAPEAYVGDVNTVLKHMIDEKSAMFFNVIENDVKSCIYKHLGVPYPDAHIQSAIKYYDLMALYIEAKSFLNTSDIDNWGVFSNIDIKECDKILSDECLLDPYFADFRTVELHYMNHVQQELNTKETKHDN